MFEQIFGVPPGARRSKPFIDHVLTFSVVDNKIWFRNFQARPLGILFFEAIIERMHFLDHRKGLCTTKWATSHEPR